MSTKVSPTLKALFQIRDEVAQVREAVAETNRRVDGLTTRVDRLESTTAREMASVATAVMQVRDLLAERLEQRDQVADHERRIQALERKTG